MNVSRTPECAWAGVGTACTVGGINGTCQYRGCAASCSNNTCTCGTTLACTTPTPPPESQAVLDVAALWNGIPASSCGALGTDWVQFAWDGTSRTTFCKRLSRSVPATALAGFGGIWPGNVTDCSTHFGAEWYDVFWDGKANLRYCKRYASTDEAYINDITAVWRGGCGGLPGGDWTLVTYNGRSNISFCARFR